MKVMIELEIADGTAPGLVGACVHAGVEDWLTRNGYPTAPATTPGRRIRIRCTEVRLPSNVSYVHRKDDGWRCVLSNGIPAAFSYAGVLGDETMVRFALEDATTAEEALAILRKAGGRHWNYELV
jgi:hypothetical protein